MACHEPKLLDDTLAATVRAKGVTYYPDQTVDTVTAKLRSSTLESTSHVFRLFPLH